MIRMIADLESKLNDFNRIIRTKALSELLSCAEKDPGILSPEGSSVNMHCHSFFSFNAYGFSPSALVWLAKRRGFRVAGIVDFDVLDGIEEFLHGCDIAGLRGSAAMETRIYIPEFSTRVTNSPGEPGISYHMGIGFTSRNVKGKGATILKDMRQRADKRNRDMTERLNAYLNPVIIDYDQDVLPLTPAGNATERHMLVAYIQAAKRTGLDLTGFWAGKLGVERKKMNPLIADAAEFFKTVRKKLMKRGGIGYVQPSPETFPTAEEFHEMVVSCGALPTICYLNGTTEGEQCMEELLEILTRKGVVAMNMIPNLAIPDHQIEPNNSSLIRQRCELLKHTAKLAKEFDLPLHIGTEMNSYGQRLVDDFTTPELEPLRQAFTDGAFFVYGHTLLQQALGLGYQSEWAKAHLPRRAVRNAFYIQVGYLTPPGFLGMKILKKLNPTMEPKEVLAHLKS
ncbi:MAG TPA: hypothetical protein G4N92_08600 [Anaerolineae bacterium]|nr:hypothetical protein [Anaerolineae bacterium]